MPVCFQAGFFIIMIDKENLLRLGTIAKPHGVSGELQIRIFPEFAGMDVNPSWLFIEIDGGLVPFGILSVRSRSNDVLLAELDTITSEESARKYQNLSVFIQPQDISAGDDDEEPALHNLTGYKVIDNKFGNLGLIKAILDIKQNPLMEINHQGKEILIPLQEKFIISIDKKEKTLHIETPQGLIELYLE